LGRDASTLGRDASTLRHHRLEIGARRLNFEAQQSEALTPIAKDSENPRN
jgi:hypothetical protein